jgi:replication-associated recombination protein RarA
MIPFSMQQSAGGYFLGEVASALQKSIRRGLEDDALYWATELDISGYGEYAWKRLKIMASEDVGLAEPQAAVTVQSLYQSWKDQRSKKDTKHEPERLFFVHAILVLARARKSREVDNALVLFYEGDRRGALSREIPDYALDKHTQRGRQMRRGHSHFWDEGARIENAAPLADPYRGRAREIRADDATLFDGME